MFAQLKGVVSVMPGYAGGTTANPTYEQVCTGNTGHAEVTRVEYDPARISYNDLLAVFFATHDPTSLNRQGADVGTEYRSAIFYTTDDQKRAAESLIEQLNGSDPAGKRIVTEVGSAQRVLRSRELPSRIRSQQFPRSLLPNRHRSETAQAPQAIQ